MFAALLTSDRKFKLLSDTFDIWPRDLMPVRTKSGKWASFRSEPSCLDKTPELRTDKELTEEIDRCLKTMPKHDETSIRATTFQQTYLYWENCTTLNNGNLQPDVPVTSCPDVIAKALEKVIKATRGTPLKPATIAPAQKAPPKPNWANTARNAAANWNMKMDV